MLIRSLLLSFVLTFSLAACSQHDAHNHDEISLNAGDKWKVHDNMMLHLAQMQTDVTETSKQDKKDLVSLHAKLQKSVGLLTSNCTMSGQAHDELHKWLVPFIGSVNGFENKTTAEDQAAWFGEIEDSMSEFHQFFE